MRTFFHDQVAIVTGAGTGLGRAYALALARHGAKVVVNDPGVDLAGRGVDATAAQAVVKDITEFGGEACAESADVTDESAVRVMVERTLDRFGRIDVLINNAGILRDRTFAKMTAEDFRAVLDVHVMGAFHCSQAVWSTMCEQRYGRILMTTSSSGLYGNFGQSNYAAAKMALIGLMNTLHLEGEKYDIHVNALAPLAATRMTRTALPPTVLEMLKPNDVASAALWLVSEGAPSKIILAAGAGAVARAHVLESPARMTGNVADNLNHFGLVVDGLGQPDHEAPPNSGAAQTRKLMMTAAAASSKDPGKLRP